VVSWIVEKEGMLWLCVGVWEQEAVVLTRPMRVTAVGGTFDNC
jgi:hypothetical protein